MSALAILVVGLWPCAGEAGTPTPQVESADVYELALSVAMPLLPAPVQGLLGTRMEQSGRSAVGGFDGGSDLQGDKTWHYVQLDVAAERGADRQARRAAARSFPRDREKARALYEGCGVADGGALPWVIEERFEALIRSFRAADQERIAVHVGTLVHFSVDAAMPFNTVRHVRLGAQDASADPAILRHVLHVEMVRVLRGRLEHETRVWPDRLNDMVIPSDAVFETLLAAHGAAMELEGEVPIGADGRVDLSALRRVSNVAPILETRIEDGALLAANLITAAWTKAGKPEWKTTSPSAPAPAAASPAPDGGFVGSRSSTVFHRATCSHAARIKPENRVTFDSPEQARSAGRTPCKTCKPDVN